MGPVSDPRIFIYRIDADDVLVCANPDWFDFAAENDAAHLSAGNVLNRPIWWSIQAPDVRHLYKMIFQRVRVGRTVTGLPYRCDAPDCRRFMEMALSPRGDRGVELKSRILRLAPRPKVPVLSDFADRSDEILKICSFCKKILDDHGAWLEVEEAAVRMGFGDSWPLPRLSHGVCDACYDAWEKAATGVE